MLYIVSGIIALTIATLAVAIWVLDPNDYKPQFEKLVEDRTNLDLTLGGDIGWSLFPLGLELNDVDAKLDNEQLFKLDKLLARVNLLSMLRMQPSVHTFVLHGLAVNLVRERDGQGNWERIFPEETAAGPETEPETAPETEQPESRGPLTLDISNIDIKDARLHYRDEGSGQSLLLDQLSLQASDIKPGRPFPLDLNFRFANAEPDLAVGAELDGVVSIDQAFQALAIDDLVSRFEFGGAPFNGRQVPATVRGSLKADLEQDSLTLKDLAVTLANLKLTSDLIDVQGLTGSPQISGKLDIPTFSPRELLKQLGQADIPSSDPATLGKLAAEATLGGEPGRFELQPLTLTLDDSRLSGSASYTLETGAINARLQLDRINVDRYLPPQPEPGEEQEQASAKSAEAETDLLPLDTLRGLRWDVQLGIGELIANNITVTEAKLSSTAAGGLITIKPLSGQLYGGSFNATAKVSAVTDTPTWQLQGTVDKVKTLPLLKDAADIQQFSGLANIKLDLNSSGNRVSALRDKARGQADFDMASGKFEGTNMRAFACEGIALANRESIDTSTWPKETSFEALSGKLTINGNTLNNTNLSATIKGLALDGQGSVDTQQMTMDYKAGLRVLGAVHEDPACRVNERLTGVVIPVKCRGPIAGEDGLPCKFDTARFRDTLKDMARDEVKQKADEEVDRTKEKLRDKAREKFEGLFK